MKLSAASCTWTIALAALAAALVVVATSQARTTRVAAHTKGFAERNIVRAAAGSWRHRRLAALVDPHTGLLRNNVRVICRGRGSRYSGNRFTRFVCAVRRWPAVKRELRLSYRARAQGRFHTRWLRVHHRQK